MRTNNSIPGCWEDVLISFIPISQQYFASVGFIFLNASIAYYSDVVMNIETE